MSKQSKAQIFQALHFFTKSKKHKKNGVRDIKSTKVYRVEGISTQEAKILAEQAFSETVNQVYTINKPLKTNEAHVAEIAYKPGVMNPEVSSILKSAEDLGIHLTAADSSREYRFYGKFKKEELEKLIDELGLYNPLIEHIVYKEPETLLITGSAGKTSVVKIRGLCNTDLYENGLIHYW